MKQTSATPEKKRLFLAVNLSLETVRNIEKVLESVRKRARDQGLKVAWVPPANMHVTLKFLGWTDAEAVGAIRDEVAAGLAGQKGFEVKARGTGAFPSEERARVLWVGVEDKGGRLAEIAAAMEERMTRLGFPKEKRPFSAHVTIGRVKGGEGAGDILSPFKALDFGTTLIREVVLYESELKSKGSEYTALSRWALSVPERQTRSVKREPTSEES